MNNKESAEAEKAINQINSALMAVNPHHDIQRNPKLHMGLNPFILGMSEELFTLNQMNTTERKIKLRKLQIEDFFDQQKELHEVGLGYINTQP